jgi:LacI family sucrose operon transcriptional repressor
MAKKNVTYDDIAKYTGFSKTTISRYFSNPDSLTEKNQQIIAAALEKLDYKENKLAKILARGKSDFIGILIPNLYLHYYAEVLNQLLKSYEKYGYKFLVFVGNDNAEEERSYIKELLAYEIEGLIVLSTSLSSAELASLDIPVVTIEREDHFVCSVNTDNYTGGKDAAMALYDSSCDILLHINSPVNPDMPACNRIKGFQDFCEENDIPYEVLIQDFGNSFNEQMPFLSSLLDQIIERYPGKKKGIFLSNDTLANIMLNLIVRRYGKFPDDFALIGFDNSPVSAEAIYPFSTVGQQINVLTDEALKILTSRIDEKKKKPANFYPPLVHKVVKPILVTRETTTKK